MSSVSELSTLYYSLSEQLSGSHNNLTTEDIEIIKAKQKRIIYQIKDIKNTARAERESRRLLKYYRHDAILNKIPPYFKNSEKKENNNE